jgi:transposase
MLRFGMDYVDRGQDYYEPRYQSRVVSHLIRRAQQLGYTLTKNESPPAASSPASA